jgi:hypothetical protein
MSLSGRSGGGGSARSAGQYRKVSSRSEVDESLFGPGEVRDTARRRRRHAAASPCVRLHSASPLPLRRRRFRVICGFIITLVPAI